MSTVTSPWDDTSLVGADAAITIMTGTLDTA
jgi:hypothetical protein